MELAKLTIKDVKIGLKEKRFSAVELCKAHLQVIKKQDKKLKAFLTVTDELALEQAAAVDKKIQKGERLSDLAGVPIAIKDNILVRGEKCTAGSKILQDYIAPYNATVVDKLTELGVVIVGKTNLDEFAMGASTENSAFFPTHNPHDLARVPGGSSGGSAVSVAADLSVCALGSDTFGSIRQPASFCGVVGLKPTYGAVSRYGLIAMSSSLDQIGPITKNVSDADIIFNAIKGRDPKDATSVELSGYSSELDPKKLCIGIAEDFFAQGIDRGVKDIIENAIKKFTDKGAEILKITLPHIKYSVPAYYISTPSEISANLARYDGIKYGLSESADNLLNTYLQSRGKGLGDEVKRRIMLGTYALSAGYYDAYYLKAQKIKTLIRQDFEKAFKKVDIILAPTTPTTAFKIGEKINDPVSMYLCDIFTGPANFGGLCAISVPAGEVNGLPVGLQIMANSFEEDKVLKVGKFFEGL